MAGLSGWPRCSREPAALMSRSEASATHPLKTDGPPAHLDHLWRISDQMVVAAGWSADRSATALLQSVAPEGRIISWLLDRPRLHRPDVAQALAMADGMVPAFGFLRTIRCPIEAPLPRQLWLNGRCFAWSEQDRRDASLSALGHDLVEACHWQHTPVCLLNELLEADLGEALLELVTREQRAWQATAASTLMECMRSQASQQPTIQLLLETENEPALHQLQIVRLHRLLACRPPQAPPVQVVVLECHRQPLTAHQGATSLEQLLWMLPEGARVVSVPFGAAPERVASSLLEAWSSSMLHHLKADQLLPECGDGLQPGRSLPAFQDPAGSWIVAVNAWLRQQCPAEAG